jgi:hypothetical protein
MTVSRSGFVEFFYGEHLFGGLFPGWHGTPIELGADQIKRDLAASLTPVGSIAGRVRDSAGKALMGVEVQLRRQKYISSGIPTFPMVISTTSSSRGEFRFDAVTPGRYLVAVRMKSSEQEAANHQSDSITTERALGGLPMYLLFPGETDIGKAKRIEVQPGSTSNAVDFKLSSPKLYRVRGRLIDAETRQPPKQAGINVFRSVSIDPNSPYVAARYDSATGVFEADGLTSGEYYLNGSTELTMPGLSVGRPSLSRPLIRKNFRITDSNVENVALTIEAPKIITGRITVDGEQLPPIRLRATGPSLRSIQRWPVSPFSQPSIVLVEDDGSFSLTSYSEEPLVVVMPYMPDGYYLKSANFNGLDAMTTPTEFLRTGDLQVVISSKGGTVEGKVLIPATVPASGIPVVFVPFHPRANPELFKTVLTDASGHFSLSPIAPGDYKVFAFESLDSYSYFDPDFQKRFDGVSKPIHVTETSRQEIELKLIRLMGI